MTDSLTSKPNAFVDEEDVLNFLGELMADYVDREQLGKADLVGDAIKLITARAAEPPSVCDCAASRVLHEKTCASLTKSHRLDGLGDCKDCTYPSANNLDANTCTAPETSDNRPRCSHGYLKGEGFESFTICPWCTVSEGEGQP